MEDVHDCLRTLREAVVIGHSMGGLVAQKAAEGGRVRAAVFVASAPPKGIRALAGPVLWRMPRYAMSILRSRPFIDLGMADIADDADDGAPGRAVAAAEADPAAERIAPRKAYLEFDAQPAMMTP